MSHSSEILTNDQVNRLGNLAIFLATNTYELTKTKLLKLVYLCEEYHTKKFASPFLGLPFQAWQFGPVQMELYAGLDTNMEGQSILASYISYRHEGNNKFIEPLRPFNDDEFSDNEIEVMGHVASTYKYNIASDLVFITHKSNSLWYKTVSKEDGLLERFEKRMQATSDLVLDFSELLENHKAKEFYQSQLALAQFSNSMKP